jgi:sugar phosphate isomerase/epimerase
MKHKISFSCGGIQADYGDFRALEIAKEIGADGVDFDLDCNSTNKEGNIYTKSDKEIVEYFTKVREKSKELGLPIVQTHGRVRGYVNKPEEDAILIEDARRDLLATKALGCNVCVIHSVTSIWMGLDADPKLMHDLNFDMYMKILPYAKEYGVKIAFETFGDANVKGQNGCDFFGNPKEFLASFNRLCAIDDNKDYLTMCFDSGHTNKATRFGHPSAPDFIRMLGKNISILHLHDNNTLTDQHKIPMSGTINWKDLLAALDEIGYDGYYNLEMNLAFFGKELKVETAEFGMKVMRNLLKDYYKENA